MYMYMYIKPKIRIVSFIKCVLYNRLCMYYKYILVNIHVCKLAKIVNIFLLIIMSINYQFFKC